MYGYIFDPQDGEIAAEFTLGDCNRQTRILLTTYDEQSARHALHKIATLEAAVSEYAQAFRERVARLHEASKAP